MCASVYTCVRADPSVLLKKHNLLGASTLDGTISSTHRWSGRRKLAAIKLDSGIQSIVARGIDFLVALDRAAIVRCTVKDGKVSTRCVAYDTRAYAHRLDGPSFMPLGLVFGSWCGVRRAASICTGTSSTACSMSLATCLVRGWGLVPVVAACNP